MAARGQAVLYIYGKNSYIWLIRSGWNPSLLRTGVQLWVPTSEHSRNNDILILIQFQVHYLTHSTRFTELLPFQQCWHFIWATLCVIWWIVGGKKAIKREYMMTVVLRELAVDSDSYLEPEDDDFFARWWWFCHLKERWRYVRWTGTIHAYDSFQNSL